jgi:Cdc6-like AAA superfamily ATPase
VNEDASKWQRYAQAAEVFTPGAPVDSLSIFAGRLEQVKDVVNAVAQRGQHVVLYGERGVGKTSLANVLQAIFADRNMGSLDCVRVNCGTTDEFYGIWRKIFRELDLPENGLTPVTPDDIRYVLRELESKALIVIDELDRLEDDDTITLLADTIKTLSDHSVPSTLVLVGVADSIDDLVGDHRSIERALTQVLMPRMSEAELSEIIDKGCSQLDLTPDSAARKRIARLSEGLPYYTHLLALHASQRAIMDDRVEVLPADVDAAISAGVEKAQASIRSSYQAATRSPRPESLFEEVLLACALAPKDELGYFTPGQARSRCRGLWVSHTASRRSQGI